MAVHHHDAGHGHGSTTTVVSDGDREGPATALIVLIALVIIGALIWFFAFSGVVFDRDGGTNVIDRPNNAPAQQQAPDVTNNDTTINNNESPAPTGT